MLTVWSTKSYFEVWWICGCSISIRMVWHKRWGNTLNVKQILCIVFHNFAIICNVMQDCMYTSRILCYIRTCFMYIASGSEVDTILQESGKLLINFMLAYLITVYPPETVFVHVTSWRMNAYFLRLFILRL